MIEPDFDFRNDSKCGDPDVDSKKLYEVQKILWGKTLPSKKKFELNFSGKGRLLLGNSEFGNFSSDRICPHFVGKFNGKFNGWLLDFECQELQHKVRTIGGHIIFPANLRNGFTINQAKGVNRKIYDRFDLTLECIRRFYEGEHSPLFNTFLRYKEFFELFIDFSGYVEFFLLQDFIGENKQINFSLPFDNFSRPALPQTVEEYRNYYLNTISIINKRNHRIIAELHSNLNN